MPTSLAEALAKLWNCTHYLWSASWLQDSSLFVSFLPLNWVKSSLPCNLSNQNCAKEIKKTSKCLFECHAKCDLTIFPWRCRRWQTETVHFGGTYKFSIDLCQVCMPFFPFCIISALCTALRRAAVGQIAAQQSTAHWQGHSPEQIWHSPAKTIQPRVLAIQLDNGPARVVRVLADTRGNFS